MPCYTVRLISVEFKAANLKILEAAANLLDARYYLTGKTAYITLPGDQITVDLEKQTATGGNQTNINALKRAYTEAAVKAAAKVKGWTLDTWKTKAGIKTTTAIKY